MSKLETFEDLDVWQKARQINDDIYQITSTDVFTGDYALKDQIRKASISISSNIAEGYARETRTEFIRYLFIAKGSVAEVKSQLLLAKDQQYLSEKQFSKLAENHDHNARQIMNLIKYLKQDA